MSDVTPPPPPPSAPAPYQPTGGQVPGQPVYWSTKPPTNTVAIVALILGILTGLGGIIAGHIALGQIKRTGEGGRGMALAGLIVGYVYTGFWVLYFLFFIVVFAALGVGSSYYY